MLKKLQLAFLIVLNRDLLYPAISITSSFDFFSAYHIFIILLMYHISVASSPLSNSFASVQHSHPCSRMDHMIVGSQIVDFGVNSDIVFLW